MIDSKILTLIFHKVKVGRRVDLKCRLSPIKSFLDVNNNNNYVHVLIAYRNSGNFRRWLHR